MSQTSPGIEQVRVGHYTDRIGITGCTVVLCEGGAIGGVDVSGASPGTRETDLLRPGHLVQYVQAVVLSGGSAFGLDAAGGAMRYLEERGCGQQTSAGVVPIVPAAILFDLAIGDARARPGVEEGYQACVNAADAVVVEGSVGAGTGATVGKCLGMQQATKGGLGVSSQQVGGGSAVSALMVVNAYGDVIDPETGKQIAGPRATGGEGLLRTRDLLSQGNGLRKLWSSNTVLGVVVTNVALTKEQANRLAHMAQAGIARAVDPVTMFDGDVIFVLAAGSEHADLNVLGDAAARAVSGAIVRGVREAEGMGGVPAVRELGRG